MKQITTLLLLVFTIASSSQNFQKDAYFIDNSGNRFNGFINDLNDLVNAQNLIYKTSENGSEQRIDLNDVSEFGIENYSKYIRVNKEHLRSDSLLDETAIIFLEVLVEGQISLLKHVNEKKADFYIRKNIENLEYLIYSKELTNDKKLKTVNTYRQQILLLTSDCDKSKTQASRLNYNSSSLSSFFTEYNNCLNSSSFNYVKAQQSNRFSFTPKIGVTFNPISITHSDSPQNRNVEFDTSTGFLFGAELEYTLSKYSKKLSLTSTLFYRSISAEGLTNEEDPVSLSYSSLDFQFGARYKFIKKETFDIYTSVGLEFGKTFSSNVDYVGTNLDLDIDTTTGNAFFGLGTEVNNIVLEVQYSLNRNILNNFVLYTIDYNIISVMLGYKF